MEVEVSLVCSHPTSSLRLASLTPYSPSFLGSRPHNLRSVPPSRNLNPTRNRQSQLEDHNTWEFVEKPAHEDALCIGVKWVSKENETLMVLSKKTKRDWNYSDLFAPFDIYSKLLNIDHEAPGFQKMTFFDR